jgi:divalent metal cation (Fe/Co/Zn/Cd) transporter
MQNQMEIEGRQSLAPRASGSFASGRASKSWMQTEADVQAAISGDSEARMKVVKCTTRFATCMCVVIAIVKVGLYLYTKLAVVRTSALDSLGDFVANCMTLYTGYRMTNIDRRRYPAGQAKFQSIGCLVFSTFMFALMFGNALGNVEDLGAGKDYVGELALGRFFDQAAAYMGDEFVKWSKEVEFKDGEYHWDEKNAEKIENPLVKFFEATGTLEEKAMAAEWKAGDEKMVTRGWIVKECAEYENDAEKESELWIQNGFLGLCATYKVFLWLYCVLYAIPNSNSNVLRALAQDKMNDFIATYSVIISTFAAFYMIKRGIDLPEDKVDPFVSLCLSIFIMYAWSQLMIEHMTILSCEASDPAFREEVTQDIQRALSGSPCTVESEADIKTYLSSEKNTIEAVLSVRDGEVPFKEVARTIHKVKGALMPKQGVERVIVTTQSAVAPVEKY